MKKLALISMLLIVIVSMSMAQSALKGVSEYESVMITEDGREGYKRVQLEIETYSHERFILRFKYRHRNYNVIVHPHREVDTCQVQYTGQGYVKRGIWRSRIYASNIYTTYSLDTFITGFGIKGAHKMDNKYMIRIKLFHPKKNVYLSLYPMNH